MNGPYLVCFVWSSPYIGFGDVWVISRAWLGFIVDRDGWMIVIGKSEKEEDDRRGRERRLGRDFTMGLL